MSLDLIDTNAREVLDLLKAAYYEQTGKTIQIGSDEFAQSAVQAYVWPILFNTINNATKNRFIDYARGEFLDALAANFGVESRPDGYHASALFNIYPRHTDTVIPAGGLVVKDESGNKFTNLFEIAPKVTDSFKVLQSVDPGTQYNGIPAGAVNTIIQGAEFAQTAVNTTMSDGGTDGFPYTENGDNAFRTWLKNHIKSLSGAGTAAAYEGRALNADSRIIDAHVLTQDEAGYQKGKVQIFILCDPDIPDAQEVIQIVQESCSNPSFRPIGDLVVVSYGLMNDLDLSPKIQVSYPTRFVDLGYNRNLVILNRYKRELASKIGKPFVFEEFCALLKAKDDNGVYASDAKPIIGGVVAYPTPIYPTPGGFINLQDVVFDVRRDNNAD